MNSAFPNPTMSEQKIDQLLELVTAMKSQQDADSERIEEAENRIASLTADNFKLQAAQSEREPSDSETRDSSLEAAESEFERQRAKVMKKRRESKGRRQTTFFPQNDIENDTDSENVMPFRRN